MWICWYNFSKSHLLCFHSLGDSAPEISTIVEFKLDFSGKPDFRQRKHKKIWKYVFCFITCYYLQWCIRANEKTLINKAVFASLLLWTFINREMTFPFWVLHNLFMGGRIPCQFYKASVTLKRGFQTYLSRCFKCDKYIFCFSSRTIWFVNFRQCSLSTNQNNFDELKVVNLFNAVICIWCWLKKFI